MGITVFTILDKIACYLFIALFFWGATCKFGRKNEFNDDFLSLDSMKSARGLAAFGVILHHISQEDFFQMNGILSPFVDAGVYFVAIFFFCSGYGLLKSYDSKKDYLKGFISKRIVKSIVVPFYINVIIYGIFNFLAKYPTAKERWIGNFLGITMMNAYAWFPIVLALLYLVFFLSFRFIKNRYVAFGVIFIFIIAIGIGAMVFGHFGWWAGPENWWMSEDESFWENGVKWYMDEKVFWFQGEWWVNTAPAFLTGLLFANFEKPIVEFFKKKYALRFHILLVLTVVLFGLSSFGQSFFGYWTEFNGHGPDIGNKIATYFCQIPLLFVFPVTFFIFTMKYKVDNPVTRFFGKYSLHTYLMNLMAISLLRFVEFSEEYDFAPIKIGDVKNNLFVYAIGVIILSVLLGVMEQKITERVQDLLFAVKKPIEVNRTWSLIDDDPKASKHAACVREEVVKSDSKPAEKSK